MDIDFDNEETICNIILQGLNPNIRLYSAAIAEQKATFTRDPVVISFTSLEETFFGIDNTAAVSKSSSYNPSKPLSTTHNKRERANTAYKCWNIRHYFNADIYYNNYIGKYAIINCNG